MSNWESKDGKTWAPITPEPYHPTRKDIIESMLKLDWYIEVGSTFFIVPSFTNNKYELAFDWLWLHIAKIKSFQKHDK